MKLSHLPDHADVPAICHYCGEAIPVAAWFGFDRLPVQALALCRECTESVAGGLLMDLAESDADLAALLTRLRLRHAAIHAARALRARKAQEGRGGA